MPVEGLLVAVGDEHLRSFAPDDLDQPAHRFVERGVGEVVGAACWPRCPASGVAVAEQVGVVYPMASTLACSSARRTACRSAWISGVSAAGLRISPSSPPVQHTRAERMPSAPCQRAAPAPFDASSSGCACAPIRGTAGCRRCRGERPSHPKLPATYQRIHCPPCPGAPSCALSPADRCRGPRRAHADRIGCERRERSLGVEVVRQAAAVRDPAGAGGLHEPDGEQVGIVVARGVRPSPVVAWVRWC